MTNSMIFDDILIGPRLSGLSCRDIKETCEHAERRWVAALIRKDVTAPDTPPISEYMFCLAHRRRDDSANADLAV